MPKNEGGSFLMQKTEKQYDLIEDYRKQHSYYPSGKLLYFLLLFQYLANDAYGDGYEDGKAVINNV